MLSERRRERNADTIGSILKEARVKAGFTQKGLADTIGLEYYTMVSQMELGYISVPPGLWVPIANALRLPRAEFVLKCLSTYQPDLYEALFDKRGTIEVSKALTALLQGRLDDTTKE